LPPDRFAAGAGQQPIDGNRQAPGVERLGLDRGAQVIAAAVHRPGAGRNVGLEQRRRHRGGEPLGGGLGCAGDRQHHDPGAVRRPQRRRRRQAIRVLEGMWHGLARREKEREDEKQALHILSERDGPVLRGRWR